MSTIDSLAKSLAKTLMDAQNKKPASYDTQAEVRRVEGDTAWVHIPGGVDETPVQLTTNAKKGDIVQVRISGGRAWLYGNKSAPPTDDTTALVADEKAATAKVVAVEAKDTADEAFNAASSAQNSAIQAAIAAEIADQKAAQAATAASSAQNSANTANIAANSALTQLSVVEDVAGVLNWISEHGTYILTTDSSVVPGKMYFAKVGDEYNLVTNPTGNPSQSGYYELDSIDETVSNYVSSHLSLTNQGLWVINDSNSYKILLSSDGMKVYDKNGNLVSTFGESISFSSNRPQYIGGEDAYIVFNSTNGTLTIGGSKVNISGNITLGGRTVSLSQLLTDMQSEIDGSIETWYYSVDPTTSNAPAVNWTTEGQKNQHLRDLYFNTTNGHSFRWALLSENPNSYGWVQITDADLAALANDLATNYVTKDYTVTNVVTEYAVGDDNETAPSTGWSSNTPEWTEGKYIWQRIGKTINNITSYTYTCIQGAKGETGASGEDGTILRIDSSRGVVFKNSEVSTILSVVIYKGGSRITNINDLHTTFGSSSYLEWSWQGYDSSTWHTISNDDPRLGNNGFTLTLTSQDVDIKIVFSCNLITI